MSSWGEPEVFHSGNYIALFSASKQTCCALVVCNWMNGCSFTQCFLNLGYSDVPTTLFSCYIADAMWNSAILVHILCTPYSHAPVHRAILSKTAWVFSCNLPPVLLAEWQGSLCVTVVIQRWKGYQNRSQHRKLTLVRKILSPLLLGLEPTTF